MARDARTWLRSILKVTNSTMGVVGIAMVLYGFWMARVWETDIEGLASDDMDSTAPWFIYTFLSIGMACCVITCIGHISADSSNSFCLSCYTLVIFVLLLLETAAAADILLNSDWAKDLPEDPTGRFHEFKEFLQSNFDVFLWISVLVVFAQAFSMLMALILRALGPTSRYTYDSDDEFLTARLPLINPQTLPTYIIGEPQFASEKDAWNACYFW